MGANERLFMNFEDDEGVYVIVTIVNSETQNVLTANFSINETEQIPKLEITSPQNGELLRILF